MIYVVKNDETGYYLRTCGGCDETDASGCVGVYRGVEDGEGGDVVVVFFKQKGLSLSDDGGSPAFVFLCWLCAHSMRLQPLDWKNSWMVFS